jgi:16S rRNA (uracil1498-N3)-methyltransferase
MAIKSVYWPQPEVRDDLIHVTGNEHQHLRVSRTELGECVELFDGVGHVMTGEVVDVNRSETRLKVVDRRTVPPPRFEIILGQALIKNPAFERVIEKAVEVGVTRIVPFRASRSNESGQGRETRWQKIIVEAAKQSKHYHLPTLDPVTDLETIARMEASSRVVFAESREGDLATALTSAPVLYLIGPEGGWTSEELEVLEARSFGFVRLGAHIMRSETAAIVAAGLIAHHLGVL